MFTIIHFSFQHDCVYNPNLRLVLVSHNPYYTTVIMAIIKNEKQLEIKYDPDLIYLNVLFIFLNSTNTKNYAVYTIFT